MPPSKTEGYKCCVSASEQVRVLEEALRQIAGLSPGAMEEAVDIANSVLAAAAPRMVESANDPYAIQHPHGNWAVYPAAATPGEGE